METDTTYNGWANRETWAFVLHCDNTIGTESIIESLGYVGPDVSDWETGENVVQFVRDLCDEYPMEEWSKMLRDDVGSWWRIDERAVGRWVREFAEEMREYAS